MATCRTCGQEFEWGNCNGGWMPLEPLDSHDDLDRTYVDENGELRADHRDRHRGGRSVNVARLDRKVGRDEVELEAPLHRRMARAARLVRGRG